MKWIKICSLLMGLSLANLSMAQHLSLPKDTTIITKGNVKIKGQSVSYTAHTGTMPLWEDEGQAIATISYTYYKRDKQDATKRPLLISFNGGPGSASVWMHIAYTGPKLLNIDDEGYPVQPYGIKDNPYSVLDVADILYVNPVNTGFSRPIPDADGKVNKDKFFGINADIKYLATWLNTFMSRYDRWLSPKYLIGESYGGTRVAGLAHELQSQQWMYLNGVIMVSPADYRFFESDAPISTALMLPYYTATAWYHKMLPADLQSKDLLEVLPIAEDYAVNTLMPVITRGGSVSNQEKEEVAAQFAQLSGLSKQSVLEHNLVVPSGFFWKELLRDSKGMTIGRLDSRYEGLDKMQSGEGVDYNPELTTWLHAFTPAINYYIREELGFKTEVKYNMFGSVHPWDRTNDNTREQLRQAMAQNPYLHVMFQSGYYDGATTYFNAKYTMWQMDPSGKLNDRMSFQGYRSGHMMYLRKEDLQKANQDIRDFILKSTPGNKPAKYE